ncbi:APA family basic amino acid/polyamine antiporter [Arcicella aurantiaca]|uniref:APA family basic amino acid/polyamine antiporter n=1 Tax=Arcicella aurantiaca TaxID=591202 RepID=A0A316EIL7_9BACT|nr:amino acid permease [Arcicella aurantiaca]PWK28668.1 APA family basic amino acid/polyamine antiporter [Arcicella aurantiaca]
MSHKNKLNLFDTIMLVVSLIIGMGIFRNPVEVAKTAQTPTIFFLAWILGGVISFLGGLTYAEIGSRYAVKGGFYKIFSYCYHPAFAFMVNWMLVISNAGAVSIVAMVGAEYINPVLMPESLQNQLGIKITSISTIVILYAINFIGIRLSAKTQNVLSMIKIVLMGLLILTIFGNHPTPKTSTNLVSEHWETMDYFKALALSFIPIFFTYGGYQQTINFGTDIENPSKNTPKGIFIGCGLVMFLYLAINFAYYKVLGMDGMANSTSLTSDLAKVFFGETGSKVTSVLLFISVLTFVNSSMLTNPRVYYAMAEDGVLPKFFSKQNDQSQVQEIALTVYVSFLILFLFFGDSFKELLNYVMFCDSIGMITSAFTIFILRKKITETSESLYTIGFGKVLFPAIFIITYTLVAVSALISNKENLPIAIGLFLGGLPLYYLIKKIIPKS